MATRFVKIDSEEHDYYKSCLCGICIERKDHVKAIVAKGNIFNGTKAEW
jgi:hypothetical protein